MKDLVLEFTKSCNIIDIEVNTIIDYVNNTTEEVYYTSTKDLIVKYHNTTNPVTRWSISESILSRVYPNWLDVKEQIIIRNATNI